MDGRLGSCNSKNFLSVQQSPRTGSNGLKLYKAHCRIDARKMFSVNLVVDVWNSLKISTSTNPETMVKIGLVDSEIIGLTGIVIVKNK